MAGALRESPYPIATAPLTGFDVPWGSEVILEGVIEGRKREIEGRSVNLPVTTPAVVT
ncbi:UbiD family decarboxylase [Klebsiella pneumoniae]|nr:UbiD family decarboxylase [Klebsiella pneumoniae]